MFSQKTSTVVFITLLIPLHAGINNVFSDKCGNKKVYRVGMLGGLSLSSALATVDVVKYSAAKVTSLVGKINLKFWKK
jgi:hypothetical protein